MGKYNKTSPAFGIGSYSQVGKNHCINQRIFHPRILNPFSNVCVFLNKLKPNSMNKRLNSLLLMLSFICLSFLSSCDKDDDVSVETPVVKPGIVFYGITSSNILIKYNSNAPGILLSSAAVTGLPASEKILAIDFRPATGQLYGLGSSSRLFIINHETAVATAVGTTPFSPAISGALIGFDFNPTVDRIRLVTSAGLNIRLNPETGAVAATDAVINPGGTAVVAVAYTNSMAGAATTTLFDIDMASGKLFKQDPPNNGTLVEIGSLGISTGNESGFDISPDNAFAIASFNIGANCVLHQIDLVTGKATSLGNLLVPIVGLAIPTNPVAYAVDNSNNLQIFNLNIPGTPVNKAITGLQAGETILGIDMRPATGQLLALGSSSRLYAINMSSGAATSLSLAPFSTLLSGTHFGFDFNPTVDRIRVVSNTGQNLRLNPLTGDIAAVDMPLNPTSPLVSSAAYTNNIPAAASTVLYTIDFNNQKLYTQNPPNNGTLVEVGNLGMDMAAENGFDIGGTSNKAYVLVATGGAGKIYSINLTTGTATQLTTYPNTVRAFAVGLGF